VNSSVGGLLDKGLHAKAAMKKTFNAVHAKCGVCVTPQMKFQHGNKFSIKEFSGSVSDLNQLVTN
jgi:hypothetical protein